ncbi:MAG: hypothetical protein RLO80_04115 [Hyphomonas sp.]
MLKRVLFLCLGVWLIASTGLSAHAGPCAVRAEAPEIAAPAADHAHCDMMAAPEAAQPGEPSDPLADDPACCCPAVMAALPAAETPGTSVITFARPASFPRDDRAVSRTLLPEPRPPKA